MVIQIKLLVFIVMDGSLPRSLKHIISNAEYYGPSLFLLGKYCLSLDIRVLFLVG